jgi:hypothetical protein
MAKKKTKKKTGRKKISAKATRKILVKKTLRKKKQVAKKPTSSLRYKKEEKAVENPKPVILSAPLQKLQELAPKPEIKNGSTYKTPKNIVSRHIVDLRNINAEKQLLKERQAKRIDSITDEIFKKFNKKKVAASKNIKSLYSRISAGIDTFLKIKPSKKQPIAKASKPKLPEITLPTFDLAEIKTGTFNPPYSWHKRTIAFIIICLIITIPLFAYEQYQGLQGEKEAILAKTATALSHLSLSSQAASAHDLYYTEHELQSASKGFAAAESSLQNINIIVQSAIKLMPDLGERYNTMEKLISAGKNLSESAAILTGVFDKLTLDNKSPESLNLTDKLTAIKDGLNIVLPNLKAAEENLSQANLSKLPQNYQNQIKTLQNILPLVENSINSFLDYADLAAQILGQDDFRRYLLIFQNSNEIRPTGGFIGSYALVDLDKGNVKKISIPGGGPYDLRAGLKINLSAPQPLRVLNQRWEFQDANWFADLPASAEKLAWFYEKSGGPTVDGLIFINSSFVENLLKITGPIALPEYGKTITADNFIQEIQQSVEFDYDKGINRPKQIIADLAPKLLAKLLRSDKKNLIEILDLIFGSLNQKDIQLYFTNYSLEKNVLKNNWGGQVQKNDRDYLEIVSTNIAGEKTDAKINQSADLKVTIQKDGSIINTLTLTKTHLGRKGEPFYGVPNLDYLRIYVPKGSEFLNASGFEAMDQELFDNLDSQIYKQDADLALIESSKQIEPQTQTEIYYEGDKTVMANWVKVEPAQTKTITLSWKLPIKLHLKNANSSISLLSILKNELNSTSNDDDLEKYSLLLQKQSGKNFKINISINFPNNFDYQKIYPNNLDRQENTFTLSDNLDTDKFLAIIFKKL